MRSFKQQADRIVELIDNRLHPATVEELLPLLKEASKQYHQENLGLTQRCFDVDIQDEFVDFAFWNPDLLCGESSSFVRGRKHKDKVSDDRLLDWISRSIRRLAEDAKTVLWYEFNKSELQDKKSTISRHKNDPSKHGIKAIGRARYAIREDKIVEYVSIKSQDLKRLHQE